MGRGNACYFVQNGSSSNAHRFAGDVAARPVVSFKQVETVGSLRATLAATKHNAFPVVQPSASGDGDVLLGVITRTKEDP
eukprot:1184561-Prorocentrum_minimum.AAC.2